MSNALGLVFVLLLFLGVIGFLGYWFYFRYNTVRGIGFNDSNAIVKSRIVTREPDPNNDDDVPVPVNVSDFKIKLMYIKPGSGFDTNRNITILENNTSKKMNHSINVDKDMFGFDILVKESVCDSLKTGNEKENECGNDVKYNGIDYKYFVIEKDILLNELKLIKEGKKNYYEFEIYVNDDNTMYLVIEEST